MGSVATLSKRHAVRRSENEHLLDAGSGACVALRAQVQPGSETAAAFRESRRYAAMLGATTEFEKQEGITFSPRTNQAPGCARGRSGLGGRDPPSPSAPGRHGDLMAQPYACHNCCLAHRHAKASKHQHRHAAPFPCALRYSLSPQRLSRA